MSDKKRPTVDENTSPEKRVRSDSTISHSSWIHKLTSTTETDDTSHGIWSWLGYPNEEDKSKDSVIISNEEEPVQETVRTYQPTHNVVLPTFESQYHVVEDSPKQENNSIFSRAMLAINSIFTQRTKTTTIDSDWQDIQLLNMIDLMKNDPDNVAGKKIVIIGVHGWFPMKVTIVI